MSFHKGMSVSSMTPERKPPPPTKAVAHAQRIEVRLGSVNKTKRPSAHMVNSVKTIMAVYSPVRHYRSIIPYRCSWKRIFHHRPRKNVNFLQNRSNEWHCKNLLSVVYILNSHIYSPRQKSPMIVFGYVEIFGFSLRSICDRCKGEASE